MNNLKCFVVQLKQNPASGSREDELWINFIGDSINQVVAFCTLNHEAYDVVSISKTAGDTTEVIGGTIEKYGCNEPPTELRVGDKVQILDNAQGCLVGEKGVIFHICGAILPIFVKLDDGGEYWLEKNEVKKI